MKKNLVEIKDIFKTKGQPTVTYVERKKGKYEADLKSAIRDEGTLCLLTGPSKTGKTSLLNKVVDDLALEPLIVRCDNQLNSDEIWRKALEKINFERLAQRTDSLEIETSSEVKVGTKFGWAWLANVLGEVKLGVKGKSTESEIREKILSQPSPDHLIPVLKELSYILVIEDFHYLTDEVKKNVFQRWKTFVDEEVSVVVLGTSHHAVDIAFANNDLVGRIIHIELNTWDEKDLRKIANQGFRYLNINVKSHIVKVISEESVGLPIITQSICLQLLRDKQVEQLSIKSPNNVVLTTKNIFAALHKHATVSYGSFKAIYNILSTGLRKQRTYNTYELLLLLFQKDPITFKLTRLEIDERLTELGDSIVKPPAASINSVLSSLEKLQMNKNIELLEWHKADRTLYILEPSFLFYLRWKDERNNKISFQEILNIFQKEVAALAANWTIKDNSK